MKKNKYRTDFSDLSMSQLQREMQHEVGRLHKLNDDAWNTLPEAVISSMLAVAALLVIGLAFSVVSGLAYIPLAAAFIILVFWWERSIRPWREAMRELDRYTVELNARTDELKRRT